MNCKKFEELFTSYLDNTISADIKSDFEKHLDSCRDCKSLFENSKEIMGLQGKFEEEQIPEELLNKISKEIQKTETKYPAPIFRYAYAVVILLLMSSGAYYFTRNRAIVPKVVTVNQIQERIVSLPNIKNEPAEKKKPRIMEEKDVKEKVIELAKLPEQKMDFVLRGGESIKKRQFIREWKGFSKEYEQNKYILIGADDNWNKFWKKHFDDSAPKIDFREYIVLAVFSEANEIQITEVKETKDQYLINVKETIKEIGQEGIKGNPFHVVVLRLT